MTTSTAETQHPVKISRFTRQLPCDLTQDEIVQRARESARLADEIESKEEALKAHSSVVKAAIADIENRKRNLEVEIRNGQILREVECEQRMIYRTRLVQEVRLDTQTVIAERPMSEEETQLELDVVAPQNDAEGDNDEPPELETAKRKGGRRKRP